MIPNKHRKIINSDPKYKVCARLSQECDGRITIEHAFKYQNKQINELWNYVPLCEYHHGLGKYHNNGGGLDKRENERIALSQATEEDLAKYPKKKWKQYE